MYVLGGVRVTINISQSGVDKQNTLWYRVVGGGTPTLAQLQALTNWVEINVLPTLTALWHGSVTVRNITARYMGGQAGPEYVDPLTATYVGLRGGDALPGNVAAAVYRKSPFLGRRNRGRVYVGSFSEGDVAGDVISAGLRVFLLNFASRLLQDPTGGVWQAAIGSITYGGIVDLVSTGFDSLLDSMRRRLTGRGT